MLIVNNNIHFCFLFEEVWPIHGWNDLKVLVLKNQIDTCCRLSMPLHRAWKTVCWHVGNLTCCVPYTQNYMPLTKFMFSLKLYMNRNHLLLLFFGNVLTNSYFFEDSTNMKRTCWHIGTSSCCCETLQQPRSVGGWSVKKTKFLR